MDQEKLSQPVKPSAADQIGAVVRPAEQLKGVEQMQAAHNFNKLAQSTLFKFADNVEVYDHTIFPERAQATLLLRTPPDEAGAFISIGVESSTIDDEKDNYVSISIQRIEGSGQGRELYNYYTDGRDCVRRFDAGDISSKVRLRGEMPNYGDASEMVEFLEGQIERVRNEIQNAQLEQDMGINRQPVGVDEINELAELLELAQPRYLSIDF